MTDSYPPKHDLAFKDELLFLQAILDHAKLIVNVTDHEYQLVLANRYTETVTGFSLAELIGRSVIDTIVPAENRAGLKAHFEKIWQGLPVESHDNYVLVKGGGKRLFNWTNSLIVDAEGQPKYIVGMGVDVTERRKAEDDLRRSEVEKSLILDSTSEMFAYYDLDLRVLWANAATGRSVCQDPQALIGRFCFEIWQDRDAPCVDCPVLRARQSLQPESAEMTTPDGRFFFVRGYPVIDENGVVTALIEFSQDITERKKVERALLESEAMLARTQAIGQMGSWSYQLGSSGMPVFSKEVFRIFGISAPQDNLTMPVEDHSSMIHPDDRENFFSAVNQAILKGIGFHQDMQIICADGYLRTLDVICEVEKDAMGQPVRLIGSIQDISERKQLEEQLRATLQEREELLKEIHHRVKNNLEVIVSLAALQSREISDPSALQNIHELQERIHTIALVHENLYRSNSFSEIRASLFVPQLVENLRQMIGLPDVQIQTDIDDTLLTIGNAIPLGLIVNELVTNAYKHAFAPQVGRAQAIPIERRIWVSLRQDVASPRLIVGDNGIGLPSNLDWQSVNSLGLRLVNRLSEQLHGNLSVTVNNGTIFELILPAPFPD